MSIKTRLARLSDHATATGEPVRWVIRWPDGRVTIGGIETNEYIRRPGDTVFNVRYRDDDPRAKATF